MSEKEIERIEAGAKSAHLGVAFAQDAWNLCADWRKMRELVRRLTAHMDADGNYPRMVSEAESFLKGEKK